MSDHKTISLSGTKYCESLDELKMFLSDNIHIPEDDKPDFSKVDIGYFEPGHGTKGKKIWLYTDDDLKVMYSKYTPPCKKVVLMWCYTDIRSQTGSKVSKAKEGVDRGGIE